MNLFFASGMLSAALSAMGALFAGGASWARVDILNSFVGPICITEQ